MVDGASDCSDDVTDPARTTTFAHLDMTTVLSQKISEFEIYSVVDSQDFISQVLLVPVVGQGRYEVARNTHKMPQDHKSLQDIIVILEMDELSEEDTVTVVRVCKVNRSLSKSFFVAEIFTGIPGRIVNLKTTIPDSDEVLSGNCDDTHDTAFYMVGDLMDVNIHRYWCSIKGSQHKTSKKKKRQLSTSKNTV